MLPTANAYRCPAIRKISPLEFTSTRIDEWPNNLGADPDYWLA